MINSVTEKRLAAVISWGTLAVTLLVTDRIGYDPVNVGKMVLLSIIAGGCAGLVLSTFKLPWKNDRASFLSLSLFLGFILFSILLNMKCRKRYLLLLIFLDPKEAFLF